MIELEVPDAATHHLATAITYGSSYEGPEYRAATRAIAASVVAAELRRLAVTLARPDRAVLLDRAAELEAGA